MPKTTRIELLIGYCQRRSLIPKLLTALAQERPKPYQQTFPNIYGLNLPTSPPDSQRYDFRFNNLPTAIFRQFDNKSLPTVSSRREKQQSNSVLGYFTPKDRNYWMHPITGKVMVRIPGGEFFFGYNKELLNLGEFWIDKTPVTNIDY